MFPMASLAVGYPAAAPRPSVRLPLSVLVHLNGYSEQCLDSAIEKYDRRRQQVQPYSTQRCTEEFGVANRYGWSEDKARQYSHPERAAFGAYVRRIGFNLDEEPHWNYGPLRPMCSSGALSMSSAALESFVSTALAAGRARCSGICSITTTISVVHPNPAPCQLRKGRLWTLPRCCKLSSAK